MIIIVKQWKEIEGYHGYYVSNYGEVYSAKVNRMLKQSLTKPNNGYKLVWLSKNNNVKGFLVHRLVYEAFVEKIPFGLQINHIDENKHNNRLDNLEVVTPSENVRYRNATMRGAAKRKEKYPEWSTQLRKPCINETTGIRYISVTDAAKQTGGKASSISNACSKKRKTYKSQIWSYL